MKTTPEIWAVAITVAAATLLVFSGSGGLEALEQFVVLVGLPFFVMALFQMYALYRALREDASELPPMRTRSWRNVLPPEEHERRQASSSPLNAQHVSAALPVLTHHSRVVGLPVGPDDPLG